MPVTALGLAALPVLASLALVGDPPLHGVMFRTGSQTSGLGPILFDLEPATGEASNPRELNVNNAVGLAIHPSTGIMYGLTDQFGRIDNQSGNGGKGLIFTIDIASGACVAVGRIDPTTATSDAPLAVYEGDLAFHPTTGVLWGVTTRVDFARLFTVDLATGLGTIVADVVPGKGVQLDLSAIAFDPTGQLWGLDTRSPSQPGPARLLRIDAATGAIVASIQTTRTLGTVAGLAFRPDDGTLLVADGDFGGTALLYRFDAALGDLVPIGATGIAVGNSNGLAGLAFAPAFSFCFEDLDGDRAVSAADLAILLGSWGSAGAGDLDGSGAVDAADLARLLGSWGECP